MTFRLSEEMAEAGELLFSGYAIKQNTRQSVKFMVQWTREPYQWKPDGWGCDASYQTTFPDGMDKEILLPVTVYSNGEPWHGETYYLVHDDTGILANGKVFPDEQGRTTITFHSPSEPGEAWVDIQFTIKVEDPEITWYRSHYGSIQFFEGFGRYHERSVLEDFDDLIDPDLVLDVESITMGSQNQIRITYPDIDEDDSVRLVVGFDGDPAEGSPAWDWKYWSGSPGGGVYSDICHYVDGAFHGEFTVPLGLPSDDLFVMAILNEEALTDNLGQPVGPGAVRINYITGGEVPISEVVLPEEDADLSDVNSDDVLGLSETTYWVVAILCIVLVIATVLLIFKRSGWGGDLKPSARYGLIVFIIGMIVAVVSLPGAGQNVVYHDSFEPDNWSVELEPATLDIGTYSIWFEDYGVQGGPTDDFTNSADII